MYLLTKASLSGLGLLLAKHPADRHILPQTVYCREHIPKGEKDNELTTLAVYRRVYIEREEDKQVRRLRYRTSVWSCLCSADLVEPPEPVCETRLSRLL